MIFRGAGSGGGQAVVIERRAVRRARRRPGLSDYQLATVEGLTDLHEIVAAIVRAALADEALATGLKGRIAEMQDRLDRLQDCAAKRRQIAKDVMVELELKKITAPDFTISIRPGMPALLVLDEAAVPSIYWQPSAPRLNRHGLLQRTQRWGRNRRRCPLQSRTGFKREDKVMGFSAKQVKALRRNLDHPLCPHTRGQRARALLHRGLGSLFLKRALADIRQAFWT